jgi:anti-anti-sigma factor
VHGLSELFEPASFVLCDAKGFPMSESYTHPVRTQAPISRRDLRIELDRLDGGVTVIRVNGEIDMASAPEVRRSIEEATPQGGRLVLDFGEVAFLASAGLSVLIELARSAPERGVSWGVVATGRPVLRPLEAVGLLTIMPLHPTVEDAVAALSEQ